MDRVIGVAVTPLGKEPTAKLTFPVKPFTGVAVTVTVCAAPPGVIVIEEGTIAKVKSTVELLEVPPPPHPVKTVSKEIAHRKDIRDCMRRAPHLSVQNLFFQLSKKPRNFPGPSML
jgi:hypothetical protein